MNSWQLSEQALTTLSKEVGYVRKPHTDRLRVALAFPNTYYVGMSNLGFQTVYQLFNAHDDVERTALVGIGPRGQQKPVIIVEPTRTMRLRHGSEWSPGEYQSLLHELRALSLRHHNTRQIAHFLLHKNLPVDVRHNAKIFREQVAVWAARRLRELR